MRLSYTGRQAASVRHETQNGDSFSARGTGLDFVAGEIVVSAVPNFLSSLDRLPLLSYLSVLDFTTSISPKLP
jgi:hypothetical protein